MVVGICLRIIAVFFIKMIIQWAYVWQIAGVLLLVLWAIGYEWVKIFWFGFLKYLPSWLILLGLLLIIPPIVRRRPQIHVDKIPLLQGFRQRAIKYKEVFLVGLGLILMVPYLLSTGVKGAITTSQPWIEKFLSKTWSSIFLPIAGMALIFSLRPLIKLLIKVLLRLNDAIRDFLAEMGEQLSDLVAECKAEILASRVQPEYEEETPIESGRKKTKSGLPKQKKKRKDIPEDQ